MNEVQIYTNRILNLFRQAKHLNNDIEETLISKIIKYVYDYDRSMLDNTIECFEGIIKFNNYVSQLECDQIISKSINQDGSKGISFNMSCAKLLEYLETHGKQIECEPHYNKYALIVTMNKFSSDQGSVIKNLSKNEDDYIDICYNLAVCQLKDLDKQRWVRWYFNL